MYKGIITPILTPFHRDEEQSINYDAASDLIEYVISHGVAGIFVLGSNGEFHVIDKEEKIEFTKRVVEMVDHRVPVFAGPGACSTQETVQMAVEMEKAGVDALSVIAPYFIQPSQQELYEHFETVARSVHVPVILYNIPRLSGVNISREVFEQLSLLDNIAGIKDSSRDLDNLQGYIEVAKKAKSLSTDRLGWYHCTGIPHGCEWCHRRNEQCDSGGTVQFVSGIKGS